MKKNINYVDGFVIPVFKKKVKAYTKLATLAARVWKEYGAIDYFECIADDVSKGKITSFPRSVKLKKDEVVFFSWITYKSRSHRDKVMKKVMADVRLSNCMEEMPFDMKRMIWGGFKPVVKS